MYQYDDHGSPDHTRVSRRYTRSGRERSLRTDRGRAWLGGVCAGLGRHFDIDPVIVRIAVVVMALWAPGFTVGGYALAWLLMARG